MVDEKDPIVLSCPTCNAPLDFDGINPLIRCRFCGNTSVIPNALLKSKTQVSSDWKEVYQLIEQGDHDQAVNLMQSRLGINAMDSSVTLKAIQAGPKAASSVGMRKSPDEIYHVMKKVQELAEMGNKPEAVKLYMDTFQYDLERAESIVSQIQDLARTQYASPKYEPPPVMPTLAQKRSVAGMVFVIIFFSLLVPAIFLLFAIFGKGQYVVRQDGILLPGLEGSVPVIAASFYNPSKEKDYFGVVNTDSGKMIWKTELSNDDRTVMTGGSDLAYLANGSSLSAYRLVDGSLAWQTEMSDIPGYDEMSLQVRPDRLIVYTLDHRVTAFETESGEPVWSRQLASYHDELVVMNDYLVIRDYQPGTYEEAFYFLNTLTGEEQFSFAPVCNRDGASSSLDSRSAVLYGVPENVIFVFFDAGCALRFNVQTRQLDWSEYQPDILNHSFSDASPLVTNSTIYLGTDGTLMRIHKKDGQMQQIATVENYDLVPLLEGEGILLVRAKRTLGSTRFELWGMDVDSGEVLWQKQMPNSEPIDPPDAMSGLVDDTDWGFIWHPAQEGLWLVTFQGEPGKVVLERIDLSNGTVLDSQTLKIKGVGDEFYSIPSVIDWVGDLGYFTIDSSLYVLDLMEPRLDLIY